MLQNEINSFGGENRVKASNILGPGIIYVINTVKENIIIKSKDI
jgi:hypothetical protein